MSIVPILKSRELVKILFKAGFRAVRQTGSHIRLKHVLDPLRQTTVPLHNRDIPLWLLKAILKQTKISIEELLKLLAK